MVKSKVMIKSTVWNVLLLSAFMDHGFVDEGACVSSVSYDMPCRATQNGQVIGRSSDKMWRTEVELLLSIGSQRVGHDLGTNDNRSLNALSAVIFLLRIILLLTYSKPFINLPEGNSFSFMCFCFLSFFFFGSMRHLSSKWHEADCLSICLFHSISHVNLPIL